MEKLNPRQQEILDYIIAETQTKGYPPSVREIGEAVGLSSSSTVHGHLEQLERKGYLRRDPSKPRAIEILREDLWSRKPETDVLRVPVLGRIAAGTPILAEENVEDYFPVPTGFASKSSSLFMLTVKGDSMINAGILDGDFVLVRQQPTANNGEIIAALIDGEATVKRFYREKDYVKLMPENPSLQPIITASVQVVGKVVGVFRRVY